MQTEERALPSPDTRLGETRARLAAEWQSAAPSTADDIARFYQESRYLRADLEAWHQHPQRQEWTRMLVHVATEIAARTIIDIGAGGGHDLSALREALPDTWLYGVEPNRNATWPIRTNAYRHPTVETAPVESADLLICIDVLEHIPDPEAFLGGIAQRAAMGCVLFEATATQDAGTPLHLKENRGWHPGRVLERHGWELVDRTGRVRVWRRTAVEGHARASMLLCAYRSVNAESMSAIFSLCAGNTVGWRLRTKTGDALISRSRAIVVTKWWQETADDVFLMIDDDVVFAPADADRLIELCRTGHDIVCGAYPVHDGGHLACRFLPGAGVVAFGPEQPLLEIEYAATGFMAVHRRVIDALVATLPLCHADQPWCFYPFFPSRVIQHAESQEWEMLSEDWAFSQAARDLGFRVWLDPRTRLTHLGSAAISVHNMAAMHEAIAKA